jgi:hypothetical protein
MFDLRIRNHAALKSMGSRARKIEIGNMIRRDQAIDSVAKAAEQEETPENGRNEGIWTSREIEQRQDECQDSEGKFRRHAPFPGQEYAQSKTGANPGKRTPHGIPAAKSHRLRIA